MCLSQTIYGEANIVKSTQEKAAVAWTMLNNYNKYNKQYNLIEIADKCVYKGYDANNPVDKYYDLAIDVLLRYTLEQLGYTNVGRVIPENYCSFWGDGKVNHFRITTGVYQYWDFSMDNPYDKWSF